MNKPDEMARWGRHANYLGLLNKDPKTPLFSPYIELFRGKKSIIHIQ